MKTSQVGINAIKQRENSAKKGYKNGFWNAYYDGLWNVGYGLTTDVNGQKWNSKSSVSDSYLQNTLLPYHISQAENAVNKNVKPTLKQNQYDALVSVAFNRGAGGFLRGSLVNLVNKDSTNLTEIKPAFLSAYTNILFAIPLRNRRLDEFVQYSTGITQTPTPNVEPTQKNYVPQIVGSVSILIILIAFYYGTKE